VRRITPVNVLACAWAAAAAAAAAAGGLVLGAIVGARWARPARGRRR